MSLHSKKSAKPAKPAKPPSNLMAEKPATKPASRPTPVRPLAPTETFFPSLEIALIDAHDVYDEADQASMLQIAENAQAIAKVKARLAPEKHPDFDGKNCVVCGEKIPRIRLDMGKVRCVHCQSALEIKSRMFSPRDL